MKDTHTLFHHKTQERWMIHLIDKREELTQSTLSRNLHEISYRVEFQFHTINDLFFGLKYAKIDILLLTKSLSCSMMFCGL